MYLLFKEIYGKIYSLLGKILLKKLGNSSVGNYKLRICLCTTKNWTQFTLLDVRISKTHGRESDGADDDIHHESYGCGTLKNEDKCHSATTIKLKQLNFMKFCGTESVTKLLNEKQPTILKT
jgi:hypothetical protein